MAGIGGVYTADRAAALSGVPRSTVYYWAKQRYLVPSVSASSTRLWSFPDLLGLRVIYWLRQPKTKNDRNVPPTSMPRVRRALRELQHLGHELVEGHRPSVAVTLAGEIVIDVEAAPLQLVDGQYLYRDAIDLLGVFEGLEGTRGPDLFRPRPLLRIMPRKLGGAPHLEGTRLPTLAVRALEQRGFSIDQIVGLYPFASREALMEGIDLEQQLERNLLPRAA